MRATDGDEPGYSRLDLLARLGMTTVQLDVYRQLCQWGRAEPSGLADACGLTTAVVLRALGALQAHGLAVPSCGPALAWVAVAPDAMLQNLLLDQEEQIRDLRAQVNEIMAAYHHATAARGDTSVVEVIWGTQAIRERWQRLQAGTQERLLLLDKPPHVQRYDPDTEIPMLLRGVSVRVIYEHSSVLPIEVFTEVQHLVRAGEQARISPSVPFKLAIADNRWGLMPVVSGGELDSALSIRPSTLLDGLVANFELQWSRAVPLPDTAAVTSWTERPDHGPIVTLLAAGLTDNAIARQLGVSPRTVQRRVSELMDRLGAQNRFQAGMQLARRAPGWPTSDELTGT
ncbi:helix-turn-helix transcriptional regulator [Actinocrispum wychmicini]|uniref:Sugar-specific transcriptional regulator TrmB n=1 Tax=Actinocrispum wychmicini TaxID=1213861 RepID=A0A4R2IKV8_9PSEU|nr:LuxR family transcriptional regulator [Actinocrispum wychmicini]TCO45297.1 sugar-specific transcriptional regulator TrmB [Actinocrispum wychmicini]